MHTMARRHWLAATAAALALALSACGGSDSDDPPADGATPPPGPAQPAPKFTYTPDPEVCAWMAAHVPPFEWPADRVGPRNWPEVAPIVTYAHPERDEHGVPRYTLQSNNWVLTERYEPIAQALELGTSPWRLWAQQVACDHMLVIEHVSTDFLRAAMTDDTAARIAHEQYAGQLRQTDLCDAGFTFTGLPPRELPPECDAPAE